jgi:hypothetical protein
LLLCSGTELPGFLKSRQNETQTSVSEAGCAVKLRWAWRDIGQAGYAPLQGKLIWDGVGALCFRNGVVCVRLVLVDRRVKQSSHSLSSHGGWWFVSPHSITNPAWQVQHYGGYGFQRRVSPVTSPVTSPAIPRRTESARISTSECNKNVSPVGRVRRTGGAGSICVVTTWVLR